MTALICLTFSLVFMAILKYFQFMGTFAIQFLFQQTTDLVNRKRSMVLKEFNKLICLLTVALKPWLSILITCKFCFNTQAHSSDILIGSEAQSEH